MKVCGYRMDTCAVFLVLLGAILITAVHGVPSEEEVQSAIKWARERNTLKRRLNAMETRSSNGARSKCPLARFHGMRTNTDTENDNRAIDLLDATKVLLTKGFSMEDLQDESVRTVFARELVCPSAEACIESSLFRPADGSCNNLLEPTWGMTGVPQLRHVANDYDNLPHQNLHGAPRTKGLFGDDLSNPRTISNTVHKGDATEKKSTSLNLQAFEFAQFLDHDMVATPAGDFKCCEEPDKNDLNKCFPIIVEEDDERFDKDYCMNFARSSASPCDPIVRQQMNGVTSYIDASNVYGSSLEKQKELRDGAFMKTQKPGNRLPDNTNDKACKSDPPGIKCSNAGDFRVNVVPSLTAYHTLFVREHNRIAKFLKPFIKDEETLFQTTRRIIIAVMQKIVYDEFLSAIMSPKAMADYQLSSSEDYVYDPKIDASIANAFSNALRFGHTWIPRHMSVFQKDFTPFLEEKTEDTYDDPTLTYLKRPPGNAALAWWLTGEKSPDTDRIVEEAARSWLFKEDIDGILHSFDLVALNLQRGRDHGLPGYNAYRKWCKLSPVEVSWDINEGGLIDHDPDSGIIAKLRSVYDSPTDIDLFTVVTTEKPVSEGHLGPTGECILGDQFNRSKHGDRMWYQHETFGFTNDQQLAIRAYSMAKLMCNIYDFETINSPNAFKSTDDFIRCEDVEGDLDLTLFKPEPPFGKGPKAGKGPKNTKVPDNSNNPTAKSIDALIKELLEDLDELEESKK